MGRGGCEELSCGFSWKLFGVKVDAIEEHGVALVMEVGPYQMVEVGFH